MPKQKTLAELNAEKKKLSSSLHRSSTRSSVWKTESPTMKRKIGANGHTTLSPVVQPSRVLHRWQRS